ncbi:MAG: hypothetical protein KIH63_004585 [Candidatus Saccharibacteria bacterium]|nr:hypothetical protein [Candidatus Saccharibacteria bacterium]
MGALAVRKTAVMDIDNHSILIKNAEDDMVLINILDSDPGQITVIKMTASQALDLRIAIGSVS